MKIVGDVTVILPFTIDYCAKGPDVEPLVTSWNDIEITVFFPPSMSDGTVGQSFFSTGWAWWTGTTLRLTLSQPLDGSTIDIDEVRDEFGNASNQVLRRLLNAYRLRMHRPNIHPVRIDPKELALAVEYQNGTKDNLPEPESAFFYRQIPADAPLERSINSTTLQDLLHDVTRSREPSPANQLLLDAEWLDSLGETDRARIIREAAESLPE